MPSQSKTTKKDKESPIEGEVVDASGPVPHDAPTQHELMTPPSTDEPQPADSELIQREATVLGPLIGGITTEQLRESLAIQTEQRELIKEFIQKHLVEGTDYGRIHVVSYDKCKDAARCKLDYHYSKAVLFKPGQEKLFSLFQITDRLERDEETYSMIADTKNLVAYKCTLFRQGQEIGHGRGCASVGDSRRDANATIKIAEKRARMDACLSLGFSEYFAQDLDDPDYKAQAEQANQRAAAQAEARDTDDLGLLHREAAQPVDNQERTLLTRWLTKRGFTEFNAILGVLEANGIADAKKMTSGQARNMMRALRDATYAVPDKPVDPTATDDDLAEALGRAEAAVKSAPSDRQTDPELVVDDVLKDEVASLIQSLGLNARGEMWLKRKVSGRPYGSVYDFTDDQWRRAYQLVQDILDGHVDVEDAYLAGVEVNGQETLPPVDFSEPKTSQAAVGDVFPGAEVIGVKETAKA